MAIATLIDCYTDYIGLSLCPEDTVPPSGVYINSLPGLNIEAIEKTATQEQASYLGVWEDVQKSAIAQFRVDVLSEIKKCYKLDTECDYDELICNNIELTTISYKYLLGVWILLYRLNSDRLNFYTGNREEAKELKDFYMVEYERSLSQAVLLFDVMDCELCCGGNPQIVTYLP